MIYYVEDDASIRELVLYTLRVAGFEAQGFESGEAFFSELRKGTAPELVLLDIMLPGEDGITVLRRIKAGFPDIPVIMVTAKGTEYDKVTGLDTGADDYISKPFGMMELISRIKAVLRRIKKSDNAGVSDSSIYTCGNVSVDVNSHVVTVDNKPVELTFKEFELLLLLIRNNGRVLNRNVIFESIWGYEDVVESRTIDVHIKTLRQKLGDGAYIVRTVRGVGYKAEDVR